MKIHLPNYHLKTLSNNGLEKISSDDVAGVFKDVHYSEFQKRRRKLAGNINKQTKKKLQRLPAPTLMPRTITYYNSFKVQMTPCRNPVPVYNMTQDYFYENVTESCGSLQDHNYLPSASTPRTRNVKLINLSYSQPSTPKISFHQQPFPLGTPCLYGNRNNYSVTSNRIFSVPITPMLNDPLKVFNQPPCVSRTTPVDPGFVDILQMIDDDTNTVDFVDRKINQCCDISLGDHNVADFLLDMSEDYAYKPPMLQRPQFQLVTNPSTEHLTEKRKCKRAKPVSFEESVVFKEKKKQKQRERKRKQREAFEKPALGLRRSQRSTKKQVSYKCI